MPFRVARLAIPDVVLVEAVMFRDHRGFFKETYRASEFASAGIAAPFVQDNVSRSRKGVLRGLHYQRSPRHQAKLVGVTRGEVFDVAVDLRDGSASYGRWVAAVLSDENHRMLFIPAGFAHGFCTLSDEADVTYKATAEYAPDLEGGIVWNDPDLGVRWPIDNPVLSSRDAALPRFRDSDHGFRCEGRSS